MRRFWISTYGMDTVLGDGGSLPLTPAGVERMLCRDHACCYTKGQAAQLAAVIRQILAMEVGQEVKVQKHFHPRHGAEFATVRRIS